MSKRYTRPPVDFQDFLDRKERDNTTPLKVGDQTFYVRPRESLSEDEFKELTATNDPVDVARLLINDYDGFIAAGGRTAALLSLIEDIAANRLSEQGASSGESEGSSSS